MRYGQFAQDSDSDVLPRRWKRESEDQISNFIDGTLDGNVASKLAERFQQSFFASKNSQNLERVKREAAEPLDHVVAIMEDIKKEMHTLEVS